MKADATGRVSVRSRIIELSNTGQLEGLNCSHIYGIKDVVPSAAGCEDCLKIGDTWFHLRVCLECGQVGCCDESKNKHATRHHHETHHPIVASFEEGEEWIYCYPDDASLEF